METQRVSAAQLWLSFQYGVAARVTEEQLQAAFTECPAVPSGHQLELVLRFAGLYESKGLIVDGETPALWQCCPNRDSCWGKAMDARPQLGDGDGGIPLPWVGPNYREGGVVLIAINLRDASTLPIEYWIAADQQYAFEEGQYQAHRSMFAYKSTRSAAVLLDLVAGVPIRDRTEPVDLVKPLRRIVRLQAVKCSPRDGGTSARTVEMRDNCPPLLLGAELEIAKPSAVLTVGAEAREGVQSLAGYTLVSSKPHLSRGDLRGNSWSADVFSLPHPGARWSGWEKGHLAMVAELQAPAAG